MASVENVAVKLQQLANQSTEKSFQYNAKEANTARTWQKMMSDTSHQREVADLKKAGLNPVLSSGGAGAQSYTTSSAQAQADNAVNAIGGLYSSKMQADATQAAAAKSAAAMKAAAATQAAAQRYAAAMAFQSQKYHSDKAYEATKYKANMDYYIQMNRPASNPWSLADKYFAKSGLQNSVLKSAANIGKKFTTSAFTNQSGTITKSNFNLDKQGVRLANSGLNKLGLSTSGKNRNLYVKAFVFGDSSSMRSLSNLVSAQRRSTARAKNRLTSYSGYSWKSSI